MISERLARAQINAVSHCLTNVDGDYKSLAKTALRLGLSCIYGALIALEYGQDILFGTPRPHVMNFDLGILDPDYVNIVANGHGPFVGMALINVENLRFRHKVKKLELKESEL